MVSDALSRCRYIDAAAGGLQLYQPLPQYALPSHLPFLCSPEPLQLSRAALDTLTSLGAALNELYQEVAQERREELRYMFLRPDVVFTTAGIKVCEIETSPFGFALSLFLQSQYPDYDTIGSVEGATGEFARTWQEWFGTTQGRFVYTSHSKQYIGQLQYLAQLLHKVGLQFQVQSVADAVADISDIPIYRCFYLHEREGDALVAQLFSRLGDRIVPRGNALYEGKKMLALWQSGLLRSQVSATAATVLDRCLLKTWIIGFEPPRDFPGGLQRWEDLAQLGKSQRMYVVKRAGNHPDASWSRSVSFLHKRSRAEVEQIVRQALYEPGEWVIQEFISNDKFTLSYADPEFTRLATLKGRVRVTPYFSCSRGELLTAKATLREGTLFVHAASDSINTAVAIQTAKNSV